jgi:hypothetical protein
VHQPDGTIYATRPLRTTAQTNYPDNGDPEPTTRVDCTRSPHGTSPPNGTSPPKRPADQLTLIA